MAPTPAPESHTPHVRRDLIFRRLFEANIIGILFADTEGRILHANDLFLRMLGYESHDLPLRWDALTPPEWEPLDEVKRRELAETGIARPWLKEYWHRDGHRVPILVGVALLEGSATETVGFVLDRTEQVRRDRQVKELAAAIDAVEERERHRIGKGIHDEIGQNLAVAKLRLEELERMDLDGKADESLAQIQELLDRSVHACRGLTFELASPVLYELGLDAALRDLGQRMERDHGIHSEIESDERLVEINSELSGVLFRIARELLFNVVKHARARTVRVRLETSAHEIRIAVADDGVGFDSSDPAASFGGFGLLSSRERLSRLGGRLEIDSTPGEGTRVEIVVPGTAGALRFESPAKGPAT